MSVNAAVLKTKEQGFNYLLSYIEVGSIMSEKLFKNKFKVGDKVYSWAPIDKKVMVGTIVGIDDRGNATLLYNIRPNCYTMVYDNPRKYRGCEEFVKKFDFGENKNKDLKRLGFLCSKNNREGLNTIEDFEYGELLKLYGSSNDRVWKYVVKGIDWDTDDKNSFPRDVTITIRAPYRDEAEIKLLNKLSKKYKCEINDIDGFYLDR